MLRTILLIAVTTAIGACGPERPAGPPQRIRAFITADVPITETGVTPDDGGWRLQPSAPGSVRLYEVPLANVESVVLTYRAQLRAKDRHRTRLPRDVGACAWTRRVLLARPCPAASGIFGVRSPSC